MKQKNSPNCPQKGLNLGGWLVLEKWMTPSVFAGTTAENEFELSQAEGGPGRIMKHRETFITEADIAWIARVGIEVLRLPIGYWAVIDAAPYISARKQLDWLMDMAERYGLKVLIDLHAAPGAQNAEDHSGSGRPGRVNWYRFSNRRKTKNILVQLAQEYGQSPALWGIELLNEPLVGGWWRQRQLRVWTCRMVRRLRQMLPLPRSVRLIVSDCYNPDSWSGKINGATLDVHHYQCFDEADKSATMYNYHAKLLTKQAKKYRSYACQQPIIIGEWSAVLPPKTSTLETEELFCREQLAVNAGVDAWFFWSYKTENNDSWNFRYLYDKGWFNDVL